MNPTIPSFLPASYEMASSNTSINSSLRQPGDNKFNDRNDSMESVILVTDPVVLIPCGHTHSYSKLVKLISTLHNKICSTCNQPYDTVIENQSISS